MKKVLALSVAAVLCLAAVALAGGDKAGGQKWEGTIAKLDLDNKTFSIKDKDGKDWDVTWNDSTRLEGGELKEGEPVHFKATEKEGKLWATWVHVGERKELKKKY